METICWNASRLHVSDDYYPQEDVEQHACERLFGGFVSTHFVRIKTLNSWMRKKILLIVAIMKLHDMFCFINLDVWISHENIMPHPLIVVLGDILLMDNSVVNFEFFSNMCLGFFRIPWWDCQETLAYYGESKNGLRLSTLYGWVKDIVLRH
jgi:hypothetical protein